MCRWPFRVESEALIIQACADLPLDAADPDLGEKLERLQRDDGTALDQAFRVVQTAEELEKELAGLRESLEKAIESVAKVERETQTAAHQRDSAEQLLVRVKKEGDALRTQQGESLSLLQTDVEVFRVETISIDNLDQIQTQLTVRRDQWILRQKEKSELSQNIAALEIQTRYQAEQIQKSGDGLKKQQELLEGMLRDRETLSEERRQTFGDKAPDDEELRLSVAIEAADRGLEISREKLNTATLGACRTFRLCGRGGLYCLNRG